MEVYRIEIKETLSRIIEVEADSIQSALSIVQDKYTFEDIVLDNDDFVAVEFLTVAE
jgi:hypothetical protein